MIAWRSNVKRFRDLSERVAGGVTGWYCVCISCERRGYCGVCISRWSAEIPLEEIRKVCPACRGICNCRICLRGDNLIKPKVQEIPDIDKLRYLHRITAQTYVEQCSEIGMETRINGPKVDIPRAKVNADEQMCWGSVFIEIFFPAVISAKSLFLIIIELYKILFRCSNREGSSDNSLYRPMLYDVKHEETTDEKINHDLIVKVVDCLNQSEVDIEMNKFIKGYSDGRILVDSRPLMLKLKDRPAPNILEEFLVCNTLEFLVNFPALRSCHNELGSSGAGGGVVRPASVRRARTGQIGGARAVTGTLARWYRYAVGFEGLLLSFGDKEGFSPYNSLPLQERLGIPEKESPRAYGGSGHAPSGLSSAAGVEIALPWFGLSELYRPSPSIRKDEYASLRIIPPTMHATTLPEPS
uniref:Zinc-finger domain-containing protein n=1 Tax=Ananas comosus var. bracteatus TaxID=296719 RepID=A0A6V7NYH4_ANACO|nr:unnamed protein product [Ananas comosus var. bracteatus]